MRRRFVLRAVKGIGSCQQIACRVPADDAQRDGGWFAARWRMLRRAMTDGLRWVGGYRVVNWRADGMQRAGGCGAGARGWHAARWRMLCREPPDATQNDGRWLAGGRQMLYRVLRWFVTRRQVARRGSKNAAPEASGWCVEGRRVANRRRSGAIFSPLEL